MYTELVIEYTQDDVAKLILAGMIRRNPVLARISNERFKSILDSIRSQTTRCNIVVGSVNTTILSHDVMTGKGLT